MYEEEIHVGKLLLTQSEIWSLKKVGQGVLELLIVNQKVIDEQTDLQTYWLTCAKQYALSFKGGHNYICLHVRAFCY